MYWRISRLHTGLYWFLFIGLAIGLNNVAHGAVKKVFVGKAYDVRSGELLYIETHRKTLDCNRNPLYENVEYRRPNGELIAAKRLDYTSGAITPTLRLDDKRELYYEEVEVNHLDDTFTACLHEGDEGRKEKPIAIQPRSVVDAGFDYLVRDHWDDLMAGETVRFEFVAPAKLNSYGFRLKRSGDETADTVEFKMQLDSFFAFLLDPILISYDKQTRRIVRYKGLTNIRDDNGKGYRARIEFEYPEIAAQELALHQACHIIGEHQSQF